MSNINRRIFLIEDNRTEGMLIKLSLASIKNFSIDSFASGKDLIKNLHLNPDIVIADMMLPDISGYELIKYIRTNHPDIRVVVVSAQKDIDLIAKIQELGVFNYLVKSESCIQYLQQVIEELIIIMDFKAMQLKESN